MFNIYVFVCLVFHSLNVSRLYFDIWLVMKFGSVFFVRFFDRLSSARKEIL